MDENGAKGGGASGRSAREARLAQALRANLRRRKAASVPSPDIKPQDAASTVKPPSPSPNDRNPD
jgi:hypothetical protein